MTKLILTFLISISTIVQYQEKKTNLYDILLGDLTEVESEGYSISFTLSNDLKGLDQIAEYIKLNNLLQISESKPLLNPTFDETIDTSLSTDRKNQIIQSQKKKRKKREIEYTLSKPIVINKSTRLVTYTKLYKSNRGEVTGGFDNFYFLQLIDEKWVPSKVHNYRRF